METPIVNQEVQETKAAAHTVAKRGRPKADEKKTLNLKYLRDKHREPVRGIFRFNECPGGVMSFTFKEFKEDEVERYDLQDGKIYTIPLGVAKHLNNRWYPEYEYFKNESTQDLQRISKKVHRCSFQSLEFMDVEGLEPDRLVQVQTVT